MTTAVAIPPRGPRRESAFSFAEVLSAANPSNAPAYDSPHMNRRGLTKELQRCLRDQSVWTAVGAGFSRAPSP